jgi:hypothetical protein
VDGLKDSDVEVIYDENLIKDGSTWREECGKKGLASAEWRSGIAYIQLSKLKL